MNNSEMPEKINEPAQCPRCGIEFSCSPSGKCWCYEVFVSPDKLSKINEKYDRCLCPACLNEIAGSAEEI
jgi:hypothetical protein